MYRDTFWAGDEAFVDLLIFDYSCNDAASMVEPGDAHHIQTALESTARLALKKGTAFMVRP